MADFIQSLWIGDALGTLERLAIASFLRLGHEYHLYCYDTVANVPSAVTIKDGNEIIPSSAIFRYQCGPGKGSVASFSDVFRYKLLLEKGGWWVDTDVVCLKPFDFPGPVVFASEQTRRSFQAATAVLKLPAGHEVARQCYEAAVNRNPLWLQWGEIGPLLLDRVVRANRLNRYLQDVSVFCPIPFWEWRLTLCKDPSDGSRFLTDRSFAVHLWHEMWRRSGLNRQAEIPATSLIAQLQRRYSVERP